MEGSEEGKGRRRREGGNEGGRVESVPFVPVFHGGVRAGI